MRNKVVIALLIASLATPTFAAVKSDPDRRAGDRSPITRVFKFLKHFIGIGSQDDIIIPRP
jgi:hypothetical protein